MKRSGFRKNMSLLLGLVLMLGIVGISTGKVSADEPVIASEEGEPVVIVLDPGHGGTDTGAAYTWNGVQYIERDINQAIADACKAELEKNDQVKVYMTRSSISEGLHGSIGDDLDWRCDYAHSVNADIFVSLHCNSSASVNSRSGAEVYISNASYCSTANTVAKTVGTSIGKKLNGLGVSNGATYTRSSQNGSTYSDGSIADYYAVIRGCKEYYIPAMIVEHSYVNNSSDCLNFFGSWDMIAQLGVADAQGILENLELLKANRVSVVVSPTAESSGWQQKGNKWVYYNEKKELQKGFFEVDGYSYYADDSGYVATGWKQIDGTWYCFNERGAMLRNVWQKNNGSWFWLKEDGKVATGPFCIENQWYLFGSDGVMLTGWQKQDGKWYYMNASGAMFRKAWFNGAGIWYYLTEDGTMATGYKSIGGVGYCFDDNGVMATGWMKSGNDWYYALGSGALLVDTWSSINGTWYYFGENGKMATGLTDCGGGMYYYLNSSGALQYGWIYDGKNWYYGLDSGAILRATWLRTGNEWYYFNADCTMVTGPKNVNGTIYCFNSSGQLQAGGWIASGKDWYYANADGSCYKSQWLDTNGVKYYFDENGKMVTDSFVDGDTEYIFNSDGSLASSKPVSRKEEQETENKADNSSQSDGDTKVADASIYEGVDLSNVNSLYKIMGTSEKTVAQMAACYKAQGFTYPAVTMEAGGAKDIETFAQIVVEEADAEGVKAEVVFAQIMHETGWLQFGGDVKAEQFNFCGMGAFGNGEPGNSFADVREGVRVEVQHLKAYASTEALKNTCIDPRFKFVERGVSPYVEYLCQKENPSGKGWATNAGYGIYIVKLINSMK